MIDIFGKDIKIIEPDEDHYQFTVLVNENGIVFLAQQYLDAIEIIDCRLRKRADSFAEQNGRGAERADTYYINSGQ